MRWKLADRRVHLNLIGVIILLGGLGSALLVYHLALGFFYASNYPPSRLSCGGRSKNNQDEPD
jgi:hypothetical protein